MVFRIEQQSGTPSIMKGHALVLTERSLSDMYGLLPSTIIRTVAKQSRPFLHTSTRLGRACYSTSLPDLEQFPPSRIRNFSIIAHVDHGKSTLADRLLEITGVISVEKDNKQVLDKLKVERERGITVKAQTVSLFYKHPEKGLYLLNLIDTPGHVDFSYEVSRSLSACQGALLLVDSTQGIQAQTLANAYQAMEHELTILPVMTKMDLQHSRPDEVITEIENVLDFPGEDVFSVSAKTGEGVSALLPAIVDKIPPPPGNRTDPLRALLFDSWYDRYVGVVCLVEVIDGVLRRNQSILSGQTGSKYEVGDIGIMHPELTPTEALYTGQAGYIVLGMKNTRDALIGDTFIDVREPSTKLLPGFQRVKPMVYGSIYPTDNDDFENLEDAINKLTLNDASVTVHRESSSHLGLGFRCGFLGLLHMDVFHQRLEQEHGLNVVKTAPTVPVKLLMKSGEELVVEAPGDFPTPGDIRDTLEPFVTATMMMPADYVGTVMTLCHDSRGEQLKVNHMDGSDRVLLQYRLPLMELVTEGFFDKLKSVSRGYASLDYEDAGYFDSDIVKVSILLNGKPVDALSFMNHKSRAESMARNVCKKLKKVLDKQLFAIAIQGAVGGKIIARETVSALRKDVTAKCYGGDVTRKRKLLEKQKAGKKRMKMVGNVQLSQDAFFSVMNKG